MSLSGNWLLFKTRHSRLKQQVAAGFRHPGRRTDELAADKFAAPERVQITELPNGRLVTLVTQEAASKHIILLHGGAYALRATESHREWMELLSADTGANVTAIDFPLTPEYTARDTVSFTVKAYQKLRDQFPLDDYYVLGDSAGGGLALVLLQTLRDQKLPMPTGTLLVSPWSDLAMTAPSFEAGADADPVVVKMIRLGWRSNSATPKSSSNFCMPRVTVGCVTFNRFAVWARVPVCAKVTSSSNKQLSTIGSPPVYVTRILPCDTSNFQTSGSALSWFQQLRYGGHYNDKRSYN